MTREEALEASVAEEVNDIFLIDPESRTITVPETKKILGVEGDGNVRRIHFKCPKIVEDDIDLSIYQIYIVYAAASDRGGRTFLLDELHGSYHCDDKAVVGDDITFSWLLSDNVFVRDGYVAFKVYAVDGEDIKWNTIPAVGKVLLTVPNINAVIAEEYPDVINQLFERLENLERNGAAEEQVTDAVQYVEQELTEEQQMQARKNLGLHYTSERPSVIVSLVDGNTASTSLMTYRDKSLKIVLRLVVSDIDVEYECTVYGITEYITGDKIYYVGNSAILDSRSDIEIHSGDNGLPFVIYTFLGVTYWAYDESKMETIDKYGVYEITASDPNTMETVHTPIPKEYIPVGLAIIGATAGQIVKISAVDENGVPTAWEPMDLATETWTFQIADGSVITKDVYVKV